MNTLARTLRRWIPAVLALSVVLTGMTACGPGAPTPTSRPTAAASAARTQEATAAPAAARTAAPTVTRPVTPLPTPTPAGGISLPSGGWLIVPEGALPEPAQVVARLTCVPTLDSGVEAAGAAVLIRADKVPSRALTLRLPAPDGASDAAELVIVRVEPSGKTTFLMTELQGRVLVATTPGFGTFVAARFEKDRPGMVLGGPDHLAPDEAAVYSPRSRELLRIHDETWRAAGGIELVRPEGGAALARANGKPDWGEISCEFQDAETGWRWYGSRSVRIQPPAEGYKVSLTTLTPVVHGDREVVISAAVPGSFQPPVTWSWDFGDGETGGPVTGGASASTYDLPPKGYDTPDSFADYEVTVTAVDNAGKEARGSLPLRVMRAPAEPVYRLTWEGPLYLTWVEGTLTITYTATASGAEPPHTYTLLLSQKGQGTIEQPGGESYARWFQFSEAGEYLLSGLAHTGPSYTSSRIRVLVEERRPLSIDLPGLPATAMPGQALTAKVEVINGVLYVAGRKGSYTVSIDWGDGSAPTVDAEVGADAWATWGTELVVKHAYAAAGRYTVRAEVCDATGWTEAVTREVVVGDPGAPAPPTRQPTAPPVTGPTALPVDTPGTIVALGPGGSVLIPEGALPADARITATVTHLPILPDGVQAAGAALSITASAEPSQPVTLRLPVPVGVADPASLAILRVEADGAAAFLMTRVENNELVAETDGFSTFAPVEVPENLVAEAHGRPYLLVGEESTYFLKLSKPKALVLNSWAVDGMATLVDQNNWSASILAGPAPGPATIHFSFYYPAADAKWLGWYRIRVFDAAFDSEVRVGVLALPPVALIGREKVRVIASAYGDVEPPIVWRWKFDEGGQGEVETGAGITELELPDSAYPSPDQPGVYHLTVVATDARGRSATGWGGYELRKIAPLLLQLEGPTRLRWIAPRINQTYTAGTSGGEPPYAYTFRLVPGPETARAGSGTGEDSVTLWFDQPGEYRLEVTVVDGRGRKDSGYFSIMVESDERLSARILELPATAQVNEKVTARVQARGGVLLTGGEKSGYRLEINWGDRSAPVVENNVGATTTPYTGTVTLKSHAYAAAGKYTVRLEAHDATGRMDWYEQEITITAAAPKSTPTPTEQTGGLLVWVRQEPAVVNANNDPLEVTAPEPRWAGSFSKMTVGENSLSTQEKYVEHGKQYYDFTITCKFDTPPLVLNPGLRYKVTATCSHSGWHTSGGEGMGEQFWYSAQRGLENIVEPREVLKYYPWSGVSPTPGKEWMIAAPPVKKPGDTVQIYAGMWNRPPCNVTWTYKAEYH